MEPGLGDISALCAICAREAITVRRLEKKIVRAEGGFRAVDNSVINGEPEAVEKAARLRARIREYRGAISHQEQVARRALWMLWERHGIKVRIAALIMLMSAG